MTHRILVIEPTSSPVERNLDRLLPSDEGFACEWADWATFSLDALPTCAAKVIIAFAVPPVAEAIVAFRWLHSHPITVPTFAFLPHEVDEEILQSVFGVADEYMLWPARSGEFRQRLRRLLGMATNETVAVHHRLTDAIGLGQLVGNEPAFSRVVEAIPLFARSDVPVLITGETGTGKEVCARAIHHLSRRRDYPFIAVDCGALPDHLLENEMFGHARGAFTDAHSDQKGLVAMAQGGTLFLDEIDSLSLAAQAKILRFLQEHAYRPLGADKFVRADINVIAATNGDLQSCIREKQFRADLYFRLDVLHLEVPPLRERCGDVEPLARHFLDTNCTAAGPGRKVLLPASLQKLKSYDWPGNVRELFNILKRAALFSEGPYIRPADISLPSAAAVPKGPTGDFRTAREAAIRAFEKQYVEDLLHKCDGNVTRAAKEAGQDRRAFGRLKKKYRIES